MLYYADFKKEKALDKKTGGPHRVYGVWGDAYLQERVLGAILEWSLDESARDFNLDALDGETSKIADVLAACANLPFLSERRVVLVKRAEKLEGLSRGEDSGGRKKKTDGASPAKRLAEGIEKVPETTVLVFARTPETPEIGEKVGERCLNATLDREIEKHGVLVNCAIDPKNSGLATAILEREAATRRIPLERGVAAHLVQRCGHDLARLFNELEKCALCAGEGVPISNRVVDEMTRPALHDTVFNLTDAIGERKGARALEIVRELLGAGEAPEMLLSLVTRHLRQLMQARAILDARLPLDGSLNSRLSPELRSQLPQEGRDNIANLLVSQRWLGPRLGAQARLFSAAQLQIALEAAHATDLATKGIEGDGGFESKTHNAAALELLVARLCSL